MLLPALRAADWPQFLGAARNGTSRERLKAWTGAPNQLWLRQVGLGFAGPVIAQGRLLLFHRVNDREQLEAIDMRTGKTIWTSFKRTAYRDDFGFDEGPRAAPTIAGGRVFTFGAEGLLTAWDFASGKELWSVHVMSAYGVEKGFFGAAGSPLVIGSRVMVNAGGTKGAGIVAFDAATGKELWKATNDQASYSSGAAATLLGKPAAVFFTREGLAALDPVNGAILQQKRWRSRSQASVNAATPLIFGDEIFLSASYSTGAVLLKANGSQWATVWSGDESLSNHYSTSVHRDGRLYGFHGRQEYGQELRCIEWKTGKVLWSQEGLGAGTLILTADHLLILRETGELVLAPVSASGFQPAARTQLLPGAVRAYPALSNGVFCARNESSLGCWELPLQP